tara:strand:- start:1691 stop:1879 length:189 start_codon:yes stop_codon:yes gene_type:complete
MSSNTDDRIIVNVARGSLIQFKDNETRDNFLFNLQHLVDKDYKDIQKYEVYKKNKELADSPA